MVSILNTLTTQQTFLTPVPNIVGGLVPSGDGPHLVAVHLRSATGGQDASAIGQALPRMEAMDWVSICYRLTPRVERAGERSALLDLGICTDAEAVAAVGGLLTRLSAMGLCARAGIGPTGVLAQLVRLTAPCDHPLALVTPAEVASFLRRVPVVLLPACTPCGSITPEISERLQRYGLRTLGHLAHIGDLALRRQFGATVGSALAAVAQGWDLRPFCPTPPPTELRIRVSFASSASPDAALARLHRVAACASAQLRMQGRRARTLRVVVRHEWGMLATARRTLRGYTDSPTVLAQELATPALDASPCPRPWRVQ